MADLWFKIKADTSELDKAYKRLSEVEKLITSFNKKLSEAEPGGKAFKEVSKQLTALEKKYEQTLKKIALLETASQGHAQKETENQRIISQAIKEAISSEKLKQETSKTSIQNSKAQIEAMKLELEELKKKRTFDNDAKKRAVSEEEVTRILNTQVKSIRQAEEQNKRLRIAVKNVVGEDKEANQTRATMNDRIQKNTEFIKRNTDAFVRQKMTIGQYKQEIKQAFTELQKGGNTMNNVKSIANGLSGVLKTNVSGGLSSVRDGVSTMIKGFVGAQAVISGFQKMIDAIKSGIHSIVDFEAANSKLAAILGETKTNINELIYDAKRLGATTRYTASEATALQIELAKLGFSKKEILDSTEYVLKFAQATGAELPEAAALAGASIRMFGATTQETEKYVASMAVATTKSALSFSYLQTAMPIVGPVAKAFNFTIEDTLALLGKLADAGFDASMSSTATRNIILNLADANGKLAKELGGNVKTLPEMVEGLVKLRNKGIDLASTLELTDKRSVAAFNAFLSGAEKINTLRDAVTNVEGDLTTMANTMTDNVQGAILGLSSAWEAFMLSFMNSTGPAKEVIDFFAKGLRNIAKELASPDERQSMQNSESISLQKQQMQEFGVIDENLKRLRALYDEKIAAGMDANQAEVKAKEEYLQSYRKELEKENQLYENLQKEKQTTQDKYQNSSFWKQALFLEKTNHQYEKQIDLQVSSMAQLKGGMFKNESVIDAVENAQLTPQKTKAYTVKPEFKVSDYVDAYQHVKEIQKSAQSIKDALIKSEFDIQQQQINLGEEGSKKQLAQIRLNYDKRYQEIAKEERELLQKLQDEERKQWEKKNPDYKKKNLQFTPTITKLPEEEQEKFGTQYSLAYQQQEKDANNLLKNLLDKYQDYATQRLDIEKKFNDDIAILEEQRKTASKNGDTQQVETVDRAIAQATTNKGKALIGHDYEQLKQSPDYVRAFENLKQTSSETLNSLLSQLENAKTSAAEVLSPDQLREYTTTIQEIMDELDARNPFQALADRKKELAEAEEELAEAKRNLDTVNSGGKVASGTKLNEKTGKIDTTYMSSAQALEKYNKAKDKSVKADAKVKKAEKEVTDVVGELSKSIKEVGDAIGGPAGEIISLIGDIGLFAMTAMSGVSTASTTASKSIQAVEKASVILAIIGAAIQIAMKIASLFKDDDGVAAYEKAKGVYESYIDILDRVIEKQKELFELNSKTGEQAYEKAKETVKEQENASRELGKQYLNSGASKGFLGIGSSASEGVKQRDDMSSKALDEAKKVLGRDYNKATDGRMTGLFDMSAKQLADLQRDAPLFWAELHDDTQKYLQQIIDCNEELTKLEQDRMEGLVKTDFSSFSDSFLDMLTDLDSSSQDFADNFEKYLQNAILTSLITDKYKSNIEALYKQWADDTESGNKLTEDEAIALRKKQEELANSMLEERNKLMKDFGWTSGESTSQNSTKGGFQTMSQDTGNELNGRFTALQIAGEEIKNQNIEQTSLLSSINEKMSAFCAIPETGSSDTIINATSPADGLREILTSGFAQRDGLSGQIVEQLVAMKSEVSGLKGIVDEMRTIQAGASLDHQTIAENTTVLAKNSPKVLSCSEEIKRNTSKL